MPDVMSALVYEAPRVMVMRELDIPVPGVNEVLIEVAYSGICGSELSGFLGQSSIRTPPLVFGHEVSGTVAAVGPGATVEIGARVTVNPLVTCGRCRACASGRQQLCAQRKLLGASLPGGNARFVCAPQDSVVPVPAQADLRTAAMVEPAAFAIHAIRLAGVSASDRVLVVGAGAIGLLLLQVLRESGVRSVYVSERNPVRRAMAEACGAAAVEDPVEALQSGAMPAVDLAIDAVGTVQTRQGCLAVVAPGGQLLLAGLHTDLTELPLNSVVRGEIAVRGVFAYNPNDFASALDWLVQGRLRLDGVVEAPLREGQAWYERLVAGDPAAKVLLCPGGAP